MFECSEKRVFMSMVKSDIVLCQMSSMSTTMSSISTNTTESKTPKEKSTSEVSCQNLKITETSRNSNIYIPSEYAIGARSPSVNTGFLKFGFLKINYDFIFHFFKMST